LHASRVLSMVVKASPNDLPARRYLAYALAGSGQSTAAIAEFACLKQAGALSESDITTYAAQLSLQKQDESAIAMLNEALDHNPDAVAMRIALIRSYEKIGFRQKALKLAGEGLSRAKNEFESQRFHTILQQMVVGAQAKAAQLDDPKSVNGAWGGS
jgi:tetratricopeptide (TPR) repeat protein